MAAAPFTDEELARLRADFPILARTVRGGHPLVYLDSGATSHKPRQVLDAEREFYERTNAAVHRGAHQLSEEGTDAYESARETIARFIGARAAEVVFTRNATEAINLVAYAFTNGAARWRRRARRPVHPRPGRRGARHRDGAPRQPHPVAGGLPPHRRDPALGAGRRPTAGSTSPTSTRLLTERTKVFAFTHVSNVLGTVNPVRELTERAHAVGALVVLDACQSVPHLPVDVDDLGVDFLAFSGHKMFGPLGIGVLWARPELLDEMPVFLTGGLDDRDRHHGGLHLRPGAAEVRGRACPVAAQAVGLAAACDYLTALGLDRVHAHEQALTRRLLDGLAAASWVRVLGPDDLRERGGAVAFVVDGVHAHDVGQVLDDRGVAVRVGHHCAWPLHRALKAQASTRAQLRRLHDPGRGRRAARGARPGAGDVRAGGGGLMDLYQELILEHYKRPVRGGLCATRSRPRCTTSTRPAATR